MTGTFIGCWVGAAFLALHAMGGRLRYKHWPGHLRLCSSFLAGLGATSTIYALTPVLSNPTLTQIPMTSEIITGLWLGLIAVIAVSGVAIRDNLLALQRDAPRPSAPASVDSPPEG